MEYTVKPEIEIRLSDADIDDIMATALDCGISYWCGLAEVVGGEYHGEWASDEISRGGELRLYDAESDDSWTLNLDKFLNGVKLWVEQGYAKDALYEDKIDTGMIDAIAADMIVQFAVFGELVFG